MSSSPLFWLICSFACICIQAYYSMMEMAAVSFPKARLHYYMSQGKRRIFWLHRLLSRPSRLFGTTLLGVNIALNIGSECSRQFYSSLNLNPDLAPLSQIFLVLILAELCPLYAARRYSEHVVFLGIPFLYASSRIAKPFVWSIDKLYTGINFLITGQKNASRSLFLTREEIQKALEEGEEQQAPLDAGHAPLTSVFSLSQKTLKDFSIPLSKIAKLPSHAKIQHMRKHIQTEQSSSFVLYHRFPYNIVGILSPQDVLKASPDDFLFQYAKIPCFVSEDCSIYQLLQEFRQKKQELAIVLNQKGEAKGVVEVRDVLSTLFEGGEDPSSVDLLIEKRFPGHTKLREFNSRFHKNLKADNAETLSQLVEKSLGHQPEIGDSLRIDNLEIKVLESSLLGNKTFIIKTLRHF